MKLYELVACTILTVIVAGCSSTGMTVSTMSKDGRVETKNYTKYYSVAEWAAVGEVGMEIWIDHEKEVSPLYPLQQATGTLGPSDLHATGLITVYFVNLEKKPMQVTDLNVSLAQAKETPLVVKSLELGPRSVTRVVPGRIPISNYGTEVALSVQFKLNGVQHSTSPTVHRRTDSEMQNPAKDFPWFQPPYYPFVPPLELPKEWKN